MKNYCTTPVTLTIHPEERQRFNSYGFYLSHGGDVYRQLKKETKDKMAKFLFEDLKCRILNSNVIIMPRRRGYDGEVSSERIAWDVDDVEKLDEAIRVACVEELGIGDGSPIDYAAQYGCEWGITICGIDQNWLERVETVEDYLGATNETIGGIAGDGINWLAFRAGGVLKQECVPLYIHRCAELVKRMCLHWKLPLSSVACFDEPNFGTISPSQMCQVIIGLRKELDAAGLQHVKIRGPETAGINFAYAKEMMKNKEAWDLYSVCSVHGFGTGFMDSAHADEIVELGKEVHINSSGFNAKLTVEDLSLDENGVRIGDAYDLAVGNVSALLVDINLRVSHLGMWIGVGHVTASNPSLWCRFFMVDPTEKVLGTDFVPNKEYDYFRTAMKAIEPGCIMRYCESSEEGDMSERYHTINMLKNQMAACAGVNEDGTWGIVILNKTDSELRRKQKARIKDDHKAYAMMPPSTDLEVELDVKALYGTGTKKFQVYKTGRNMECEESGIIELVDGKGVITVHPIEIIALREII